MLTSSNVVCDPHAPLLMVQRNMFCPTAKLLMVVVGEFAFTIIPEPETNVHVPAPGNTAAFAAIITELAGVQIL